MLRFFRRRLGLKLFNSYLIVIIVGTLVLAVTAELIVPSAFDRHLSEMGHMMSGMGMEVVNLEGELFSNFRDGVTYALSLAAISAFITALAVSWFVARQVVQPVGEMVAVSQRIAEGDYRSRVHVSEKLEPEEMDELAQLALSFNQMANRLDQTEAMRSRLIGDVAHELRTPLATIKGSMEGLIDGILPANEVTFLRVYQEADRLQRLVMDLQELSQIEANAAEFHFESIHLEKLIKATMNRLQQQFEDKNVTAELDVPNPLPQVKVDPDRIQQVIINLIGNALQYTPESGLVKISARVVGGEVVVSIRDTGIGISAEHLPHIFTRFYRVDKSRSRAGGGSGIGLTIAKHLIEAHGGRIWVESAGTNQGSTFSFSLPIQSLQKL